jgi:ABC-type lipoprotein release transport system permease subunit
MTLFMIRESLGMAGRALLANRLRSILALLGIVIGVGTVIGMVALINGFQRSFQQSIQSFGNNTIYIRRIRPGIQFSGDVPDSLKQRKAFTMDDAEAIMERAPAVKAIAPFKFVFENLAAAGGEAHAPHLLFRDQRELPDHPRLRSRARAVLHPGRGATQRQRGRARQGHA